MGVENKTTPSEDRCTWKHNNVLRVLCNAIVRKSQQRYQESQKKKKSAPDIHFVIEKATATTISSAKIHNKKRLSTKILLPQTIGLTVPIEERIAFWNEKKTSKYEKMIADHGFPSWNLKCIAAEVGCQGYIPP